MVAGISTGAAPAVPTPKAPRLSSSTSSSLTVFVDTVGESLAAAVDVEVRGVLTHCACVQICPSSGATTKPCNAEIGDRLFRSLSSGWLQLESDNMDRGKTDRRGDLVEWQHDADGSQSFRVESLRNVFSDRIFRRR